MQDEIDLFDWMDEVENDGEEVINVRTDDDRDELSDGDSVAVEFAHAFERTRNTLIGEVTDVTNDAVDGHVVTFEADGVTYVVRGQRVEKYGESGSYRLRGFYAACDSDGETVVADGGRNGPHPTTVPANADERTDELTDDQLTGRSSTEQGGRELVAETCEECGANVMIHAWHTAAGVHALTCPLCDTTREA